MRAHYGDYPTSAVVRMPFDSFAGSTGAPSATSNFANTDILIYKNGNTTQRSSAAGITVSTSYDGQTGLQLVEIDTSDNTDAGFYAAGNDYLVAVADITIDSQTVRFWLGGFSIERSGGILALVKTLHTKVDTIDDFVDTEIAAIITTQAAHTTLLNTIDGRIDTEVAAILAAVDTEINTIITNIAALNNISAATVKAQVVAALDTDTYAEPGQASPASTATLASKINYLYKAWRNKKEQTASEQRLFNAAGTIVDQKSTVADDGTTFTAGVKTTGP